MKNKFSHAPVCYLIWMLLLCVAVCSPAKAGDIDDKTVVKPARQKRWQTFSLHDVRLAAGGDFYTAMMVSQNYLLGLDVERMLNGERRRAGLPSVNDPYPGSFQPKDTRPGDLNHYLSGISLMYAQSGREEFLQRSNYIVEVLRQCEEKKQQRIAAGDTLVDRRINNAYKAILAGRLQLEGPDEFGSPWGGLSGLGNFYYGMHKQFAALRDAYLYCNNREALRLWTAIAEPTTQFVLKANPDLFDDMLDVEHGGMNEVYADLYALTGDTRYMAVSKKFNHQKLILNMANGTDNLYGRHANMQVPTLVGTARQYQLTGDAVSNRATKNFLDIIFNSHMSAIGGNSCYERFGRPGEISKRLGYTGNETCNTYNMQKVALQAFETDGNLQYMDYFERALYNHILASQDAESGGVTYYMSLMPGGFKAFSNVYDLTGVWCCVGTGMENHSKYGEAIFFHDASNVLVNLFIPSTLQWKEKGCSLSIQTAFPATDDVKITVNDAAAFRGNILIRKPHWMQKGLTVQINNKPVAATVNKEGYIVLQSHWKKGDVVKLHLPQSFQVEPAKDDANLAALFRGPVLLAEPLGAERMPGSDLVRHAHYLYREWVPPTDDIPVLVADKKDPSGWLKADAGKPLQFTTSDVGWIRGKLQAIPFMPFYKLRHQRQNVYFKLYDPQEWQQRKQVVSDEVNLGNAADEALHHLQGEGMDTTRFRDDRNFWENNRIGRWAKRGGWFSYDLKLNDGKARQYLVVTYWGGEPAGSEFDVVVNGTVVGSQAINASLPLTYFEEVYALPQTVTKDRHAITVSFRAKPGKSVGKVYGLLLTSDPERFRYPLFY